MSIRGRAFELYAGGFTLEHIRKSMRLKSPKHTLSLIQDAHRLRGDFARSSEKLLVFRLNWLALEIETRRASLIGYEERMSDDILDELYRDADAVVGIMMRRGLVPRYKDR